MFLKFMIIKYIIETIDSTIIITFIVVNSISLFIVINDIKLVIIWTIIDGKSDLYFVVRDANTIPINIHGIACVKVPWNNPNIIDDNMIEE